MTAHVHLHLMRVTSWPAESLVQHTLRAVRVGELGARQLTNVAYAAACSGRQTERESESECSRQVPIGACRSQKKKEFSPDGHLRALKVF